MNSDFGIHIENEELLQPFAIDKNLKKLELHDWQRRAIEYFFTHNHKAVYQVATGSGKTILAIEILKKIHNINPELRCLIVVPKNVILETGWLPELWKAGYNLPDIGIFYGLGKEYAKVTITNMQSIKRVAIEIFDVIILDECHNYTTKRLIKILQHPFPYMIGLSATVEKIDNSHWDLLKLFEYNVFKYSPNEAINEGVLNPFSFYNISVEMDLESYEEYINLTQDLNAIMKSGGGFSRIMRTNTGLKFRMLTIMNKRKQLINNYYRKFDVAKFVCLKHKDEKILVFNQFNMQTTKLYWHLLDAGVQAKIVHSGIKKEDITKSLSDFKKGKINTILTTKVLDEGWNMPAVEVAVIMAGDSTAKQTIQRMGRVLRKKEKESILYQVYCKGTIEEDHAIERAKLFKQLASYYNDYEYKFEDKELKL